MFYGEHDENTLFSVENTRDTGQNFWRTCSLLFFYWREKILCVFHNMTNLQRKKKDFKIRFFKRGNAGTPAVPY